MSGFGTHPWLSASVVPLAWCWRIERSDGVVLGLTTHDRVLTVEGLSYRPEPGIRPSAIRQKAGPSGDSFDVSGALSSATIAAADLASGRWNGARLALLVVDWQQPELRHLVVADGRLGSVSVQAGQFVAELAGRDAALLGPSVPETSAECRAELGDRACGVALVAHSRVVTIMAASGNELLVDAALVAGDYAFGRLRWIDGAVRGLTRTIVANAVDRVTLSDVPAGVALAGVRAEIVAGCDKRAVTCGGRFGNIVNFRGEPHLPGIDLLTRFPGN